MLSMNSFIIYLLTWFTLVSASDVVKPSQDDFYTPRSDLSNFADGTILKSRVTPGRLRSLYFPMNVKSWQISVKSTDIFNESMAIVNTVIQPKNFDPEKVVVFQFAQDSSCYDCAPSYALRFGASMSTLYNQLETIALQLVLDKGYTIVATDYEGPTSNFPGGKQSGYSTLDSIRAITNSYNITGLSPDSKFILWGYSGGSVPVAWASTLIDEYPEIKDNVIGAVVGGMVSNLTSAAVHNEGSIYAGLVASAVAGLCKQYPALDAIVQAEITPEQYQELLHVQNTCLIPNIYRFMWHKFFGGMWTKSGYGVFTEVMMKIINENTVALNEELPVPKMPIFLYHAKHDEILPWSDTKLAYDNWCEWGAESVEFLSDSMSQHITGFVASSPAVVKWMMNRFDGIPPVQGCQRVDKFTFLRYPDAGWENINYLKAVGKSLLGMKLGPTDNHFPLQFTSGLSWFTSCLASPIFSFKVIKNYISDMIESY